jgi:hypothetical protein
MSFARYVLDAQHAPRSEASAAVAKRIGSS